MLAGLDLEEEMVSRLQELHERASPREPSPFQEAINSFVVEHGTSYIDVQRHQANNNPEGDRPATVVEVFSIMDNADMVRLRMGGMFLRALAEDSSVKLEAEATFADWCAEEPQTARPDRSRSMISWQFRRMRSLRLSRTRSAASSSLLSSRCSDTPLTPSSWSPFVPITLWGGT